MKRVKAACICQTLHFLRKEELGQTEASVQEEVERYKQSLDKSRTQKKIPRKLCRAERLHEYPTLHR